LEHYKIENERLIKMLAQTSEFSDFAKIALDSGLNVRYMDPLRQPEGCHYPKKKDTLKDIKEAEERDDWIP